MKKNLHKKITASAIVAGALVASGAMFLPACNRPESVYGPPPSSATQEYDPESNLTPTVYGPPQTEEYDPESNINEDVYGPPPGEEPDAE